MYGSAARRSRDGMRVMSRVKPEEGWMRDAISGLDLLFRKADAA